MSTSSSPLLKDQQHPIKAEEQVNMDAQNENNDVEAQMSPNNENEDTKDGEGKPFRSIIIILVVAGICFGISYPTSTYYECLVSFGVNYLSFIAIAWPWHTEKYYDFTGSITFWSCNIFSIAYNQVPWTVDNIRNIILFFMVGLWTSRLGYFLLNRIRTKHGGKDKRFDNLRNNFFRFMVAWTIQAVWAYFCCMPIFIVNQIDNDDVHRQNIDNWTPLDIVGWSLWVIGWGIEIISDRQKTVFKNNPANKGKFCNAGLWSLSRHPNYFGEIVLWIGIFISSASVAKNAGWLAILSPVWTIILLVFSSGIPLAERTSLKKYGEQEEYQKYIKEVSVLIPLPCCWKCYYP